MPILGKYFIQVKFMFVVFFRNEPLNKSNAFVKPLVMGTFWKPPNLSVRCKHVSFRMLFTADMHLGQQNKMTRQISIKNIYLKHVQRYPKIREQKALGRSPVAKSRKLLWCLKNYFRTWLRYYYNKLYKQV